MNVCLNQVLCLIIPFLLLLWLGYFYLNFFLLFSPSERSFVLSFVVCITIDILHFFVSTQHSFSAAASWILVRQKWNWRVCNVYGINVCILLVVAHTQPQVCAECVRVYAWKRATKENRGERDGDEKIHLCARRMDKIINLSETSSEHTRTAFARPPISPLIPLIAYGVNWSGDYCNRAHCVHKTRSSFATRQRVKETDS